MNPRKNKGLGILKKGIGIFIIPLICFVAMEIACAVNGITLFDGGYSTFQLFLRGATYVFLLSLGVSINMHTGRFDFSTGAVMLLAGIIGAKVAYENNLGPTMMIVISAASGLLIGCLTGVLYVLLKLPPMIIGLGMALVYEGIVGIITDGLKPIRFGTDASYYTFAINPIALGIIIVLALVIMIYAFSYTKFGYDYRALQSGQKIAVNTGVKEKLNAVICYSISGFLFGIAGALSIASTNGTTPTINFTSVAKMFSCFLPLFFAGFIEKYLNKQVAILIGCISYEFIIIGFGQISYKNQGFTLEIRNVVEAIILVGFLIYTNNQHEINEVILLKKLRAKMKEKKANKELTVQEK